MSSSSPLPVCAYLACWFCTACPRCGAENWVYDGDTSDLFAREELQAAASCRSCKKPFLLREPLDWESPLPGDSPFPEGLDDPRR